MVRRKNDPPESIVKEIKRNTRRKFTAGGTYRSNSINQIHDLYYKKIILYLKRIVGEDQAEDLTQEVFIKINKNLDSLQDEKKLSSWIYSIALNTARDSIRMKKSRVAVMNIKDISCRNKLDGITAIHDYPDTRAEAPPESLEKQEMIQCYIDYIKKLPKKYYEIYVLNQFEHLTNEEISQRLSLNIDTVKIRLHRARTMLFEQLRKNCSCYCNKDGNITCEPKK